MTKTTTGRFVALAAGGFVYYAADARTALALIVVLIFGAVAYFDERLDDVRRSIDAVVRRLDEGH